MASTWEIKFDRESVEETNIATLSIRLPKADNQNLAESRTTETSDGHKLFRNFFAHIRVGKSLEISQEDPDALNPVKASYELGEPEVWP